MRDCYKKFWKTVLIEKMGAALPQYMLKESASRRAADEVNPSSKPIKFAWNAIDKMIFTIEFAAPGKQDNFESYCSWSEAGRSKVEGLFWLDHPFEENTFCAADAAVYLQTLSLELGDKPRVMWWKFWEPKTSLFDDRPGWYAEFMAEEMRAVSDEEARQRVEVAVDKALIDIKRCALPWFEKKLDWYQKNRK